MLGGAPAHDIDALRDYGKHIGMAFQIVDDVLDFEADSSVLGKPAGNDLRQGTITLPTLLYMERCGGQGAGADLLRRVVNDRQVPEEEFRTAIDLIRASGVLDEAYAEAERYSDLAKRDLEYVPAGDSRNLLLGLADVALQRTY